ncbi:SAM-dependent methyltransferase [Streptomyces sp. WMMC905]|uniref:SAM-dependent methyltransferase n=1 Tax=Streptomyces sp. WMMC905 TaxID=3404123 RepID=UPI003B933372
MTRPSGPVPRGGEASTPSVARMYDLYAGGDHGDDPDREAAGAALRALPGLDVAIRANRAFLRRAVRIAAERGITQFLDVGSGYLVDGPGNVHDAARQVAPGARVAYVELDPAGVAHNRALLKDDPAAIAVQGDLLAPQDILADPDIRALLDFERPVALTLAAVLHFIDDRDDPGGKVAVLRDALAAGSVLIVSHAHVHPGVTGADYDGIQEVYRGFGSSLQNRGPAETRRFFDGFTLLEPGLTGMADWHPDAATEREHPMSHSGVVGMGVKDRPA